MRPSPAELAAHRARAAEKAAFKEKYAATPDGASDMSPEQQWQHMWELQQLPRTPGPSAAAGGMYLKSPPTPRTRAFGDLEGGSAYQQAQGQGQEGRPGWVAHAHGQPSAAGSWYGRREEAGFVQVQQVSPVAEQEEYGFYGEEAKGKGVGFAH